MWAWLVRATSTLQKKKRAIPLDNPPHDLVKAEADTAHLRAYLHTLQAEQRLQQTKAQR